MLIENLLGLVLAEGSEQPPAEPQGLVLAEGAVEVPPLELMGLVLAE